MRDRAEPGAETAVVVVDVLSAYDHEDADVLAASVERALPAIASLVREARERGILVVYVNDNFEDWTVDRGGLVERALAGKRPELVHDLVPDASDALIVKGRHSIFWETPLAYLLARSGVETVVLCGQVTEQCVLYSALDAYIRHFKIVLARDACADIDPELAEAAVKMMERNMRARICDAASALPDRNELSDRNDHKGDARLSAP
jgi:nicotinamidase-related amidase